MLTVLDHLPDGFFEVSAKTLHTIVPGPTMIHLKGAREPELFVAVLQHGNETAGFDAIQNLLRKTTYGGGDLPLPRSMSLFLSNVEAAAKGLRFLPGHPDFNRIWPGGPIDTTPEHAIMEEVTAIMRTRNPFASIDIHATTGLNPHYACVNGLDAKSLHLASFFSRTVVYFLLPRGVQSITFCDFCPAVTLECGKVGDKSGADHAEDYVWAILRMADFPAHDVAPHDVNLYHTVGRVTVRDNVSFGFGDAPYDIRFVDHLDHYNFTELPEGTILGRIRHENGPVVEVRDEDGKDITSTYFEVSDGLLKTRAQVMPSMLTKDEKIIRSDCLCYVMERLPFAPATPEA